MCLPVLTYGCQLWYTGKQKMLVKKLQTVQNDVVRIISGAFRTTPRELLHQLLTILPMDLRLDMLTQSTALRLYRVPNESQLRRRLGEQWYTLSPDELPLPTPNNTRTNTTLRRLAAKVSPHGPRVDPFPILPEGAPSWNGRCQVIPKLGCANHEEATAAWVNACKVGLLINIFCEGVFSNKNCTDAKQVGAALAALLKPAAALGFGPSSVRREGVTGLSSVCFYMPV
jgi:hypothetical protein